MGMQHHAEDPEQAKRMQRLLDELQGKAQREWPHGRVSGDDDGESAFAVATDHRHGIIRIQFAKPMQWIGLDVKSATQFRDMLTNKIEELRRDHVGG